MTDTAQVASRKRKCEDSDELRQVLDIDIKTKTASGDANRRKLPKLKSAPKEIERDVMKQGSKFIIATDETGVGSLAGPLCVCAVHVPLEVDHEGVRDSKSFQSDALKSRRDDVFNALNNDTRVKKQIVFLDHEYVDQHNNLQTRLDGMTKSVEQLIEAENVLSRYKKEDIVVLIDGNRGPKELTDKYDCRLIVKGDTKSYAIGAASIFAKVVRDRYMTQMHKVFPEYNWVINKGYPSDNGRHMRIVSSIGNSPFHRKTFHPCKTMGLSVHAKEWLKTNKISDKEYNFDGFETTFKGAVPASRLDKNAREPQQPKVDSCWW